MHLMHAMRSARSTSVSTSTPLPVTRPGIRGMHHHPGSCIVFHGCWQSSASCTLGPASARRRRWMKMAGLAEAGLCRRERDRL